MLLPLLLAAVAVLLSGTVNAAAATVRPHILLIALDDIGRTDTGVYGKSNVPMPHLVKLASEGAVLENLYTQPVCSPTRSSLMTGRYPFHIGMQHTWPVGTGQEGGIPLDTPILPELLKKAGYDTHAIGKWHCGYATWQHTPFYRGFSSYVGYLQGQVDYWRHHFTLVPPGAPAVATKLLDGLDFWRNDKPLWSAAGNYSLDVYDQELTRVLSEYAGKRATPEDRAAHPLFIYLAHQTVHIPLEARRDEYERCGHLKHKVRRVYCDMLVELDDSIGSTVQLYKDLKLWDNTLVLLTTDNGGMVNYQSREEDGYPIFPASQGSNFPLRGSKTTLSEGGVRGLAFISGGAFPKQHSGLRFKGLAHVVDLSATVLAAAGLFVVNREKLKLDGVDLLPLITNSPLAVPRVEVPININNKGMYQCAIRFGRYKLIVKDDPAKDNEGAFDVAALIKARSYYDENGDFMEQAPDQSNKIVLFDIEHDEQERHDLAGERPDLVQYGLDLIQSYATGLEYRPQQGGQMHISSTPLIHGGKWAPFMSEREWRRNYLRRLREAGIVGHQEEEEEAEDAVHIPQVPHF